jgi:hypothetical protein
MIQVSLNKLLTVAAKMKIRHFYFLYFCVYPTYFILPLLGNQKNSHLVTGLTDVDGGMQLAQVLKSLRFPWSTNFYTDFPTGASIWRTQNFSQGIMIVFLWLATRLFSAPLSLTLFVLLGWVITGYIAYLLAMKYGVQRIESIFCGVAVQFLPFFRTNAGHYITYVWIAVPLLLVLLLTNFARNPNRKSAIPVVAALLLTAFFDGYWFYFSLFICVIFVFSFLGRIRDHFQSLSLKNRCTHYCAPVLFATLGYFLFLQWIMNTGSETSSSRPISIPSVDLIRGSAGKLTDYVTRPWSFQLGSDAPMNRPIGYVGIVIAGLALFALVWCLYKKRNRTLVATTIGLMTLTIAPELKIFSTTIPLPSGLIRHFTPGLQYPVRAALIVECLLVIFAALGISELRKTLGSNKLVTRFFLLVIILAASLDLNPLGNRIFSAEYEKYEVIREILDGDPSAVVMAAPENKVGRSWHEQWFMEVPFGNSLYNDQIFQDFDKQAANGEASLAAFLNQKGINYLYTFANADKQEFGFPLTGRRFRKLATVSSFGYEDGPTLMALYKVSSLPGDTPCSECKGVTQVETNENLVSDDGRFSFWNIGSTAEIKGYLSGPFNFWRDQDGKYELTFDVYSLNHQILSIKDLNGYSRVQLKENFGYRIVQVFSRDQAIEIMAEEKCAIPREIITGSTDGRQLCFNISNLKISRLEN